MPRPIEHFARNTPEDAAIERVVTKTIVDWSDPRKLNFLEMFSHRKDEIPKHEYVDDVELVWTFYLLSLDENSTVRAHVPQAIVRCERFGTRCPERDRALSVLFNIIGEAYNKVATRAADESKRILPHLSGGELSLYVLAMKQKIVSHFTPSEFQLKFARSLFTNMERLVFDHYSETLTRSAQIALFEIFQTLIATSNPKLERVAIRQAGNIAYFVPDVIDTLRDFTVARLDYADEDGQYYEQIALSLRSWATAIASDASKTGNEERAERVEWLKTLVTDVCAKDRDFGIKWAIQSLSWTALEIDEMREFSTELLEQVLQNPQRFSDPYVIANAESGLAHIRFGIAPLDPKSQHPMYVDWR
jgi:hypothetical protein